MGEAPQAALALAAAGAVGYATYRVVSPAASDPDRAALCRALAAAGGTQSMWDAVKSAASHFFEDATIGALALEDRITAAATAGLIQPTQAADFFAWWTSLSAEERHQVEAAEKAGLIDCALRETGQQLASAGLDVAALVAAALVAVATYHVARALESAT